MDRPERCPADATRHKPDGRPFSLAIDVQRPTSRVRLLHQLIARQVQRAGRTVVLEIGDAVLPAVVDHFQASPRDAVVDLGHRERVIPLNPFRPGLAEDERRRSAQDVFGVLAGVVPSSLLPGAAALAVDLLAAAAALPDPSPLQALAVLHDPRLRGTVDGPRGGGRWAAADEAVADAVSLWLEALCAGLRENGLDELLVTLPGATRLADVIAASRATFVSVADFTLSPAARPALLALVLAHVEEGLPAALREPEGDAGALVLVGPTAPALDQAAPLLRRLAAAGVVLAIETCGVLRCDGRALGLLATRNGAVTDRARLPASHPLVHAGLVPGAVLQAAPLAPEKQLFEYRRGSHTPRRFEPAALPPSALGWARLRTETLHRHGADRRRVRAVLDRLLLADKGRKARRERARALDQAFTDQGLLQGFLRVRRAGGGPGPDGVSVDAFEADLESNLRRLRTELNAGIWRPRPLKRVLIPKDGGGERPLDVSSVRDRVVQSSIALPLTALVDSTLDASVYGYRPGIGAHMAIHAARAARIRGAEQAVKVDVRKAFERVEHALVWPRLAALAPHEAALGVLRQFFRQWAAAAAAAEPRGIAQGSPLSPLLLNIHLTPLDEHMRATGAHYLRYADDVLLLARSADEAEAAVRTLERFLVGRLHMELNAEKTRRAGRDVPVEYLGVVLHGDLCRIPSARLEEFRRKAAALLDADEPHDVRVTQLNQLVEGFGNYYRLVGYGTELDLAALDADLEVLIDRFCLREGIPVAAAATLFRRFPRPPARAPGPRPTAVPYGAAARPPVGAPHRLVPVPEAFDPLEAYEEEPGEPLPRSGSDRRFFSKPADLRAAHREAERAPLRLDEGWLRIQGHGLYLTRHKETFIAKKKGEVVFEAPLVHVQAVHVLSWGVTFSNYLLQRLAEEEKPVLLADPSGRAHGAVLPLPGGRGAARRKAQGGFAASPAALTLAVGVVQAKVENQRRVLLYYTKYLKRTLPGRAARLEEAADRLRNAARGLRARDLDRDHLFAAEAHAAKTYWESFALLLEGRHAFPGRVKHGASDLVNVLLNYGYAVVAGHVWQALVVAGLDPALGFFHSSRADSTGLVFDLMEEFRAPVVDRAVLSLLRRGAQLAFNEAGDLRVRSRNLLVAHLEAHLGRTAVHRGQKTTLRTLIRRQATAFAGLVTEGKPYLPFRMRW